jgi:hypothetical protein
MTRMGWLGLLALGWVCSGAAAWAQVPVDGVYAGGATIAGSATSRAANGRCPQTISFTLPVRGRSFPWKLATGVVEVPIAADGTFYGQNAGRFINGQIAGTHFAAQTTGRGCNYVWSLDRR